MTEHQPVHPGETPEPHHDPEAQKGCLFIMAFLIAGSLIAYWIFS